MNFYDVRADGYHTPLTKTQIADLFHAGRLARNYPCKQVEKKEWRTIDELFPLLKYDSSQRFPHHSANPSSSRLWFGTQAIVISALITLAVSLFVYFTLREEEQGVRASPLAHMVTYPPAAGAINSQSAGNEHAQTLPNKSPDFAGPLRLAQERSNIAERELAQAQAARLAQERVNAEQRERALQKAAGRTHRIPLDHFTTVPNVGGSDVVVKIHDQDITTIEVWTGNRGPVRMTKQKGITGSRTDETLIYRNGRAHLYYVWEISGKLNHCLLRVRDE